jgi:hypothetical protein
VENFSVGVGAFDVSPRVLSLSTNASQKTDLSYLQGSFESLCVDGGTLCRRLQFAVVTGPCPGDLQCKTRRWTCSFIPTWKSKGTYFIYRLRVSAYCHKFTGSVFRMQFVHSHCATCLGPYLLTLASRYLIGSANLAHCRGVRNLFDFFKFRRQA